MSLLADRYPTQRGIGFFGLIFFGSLFALAAIVAIRVAPSALEYTAIERTVKQLANSGQATPSEIRAMFDKLAGVDDIASVAGKDLRIDRDGSMLTIAFSYEKRIPIYGPVSMVIEYRGRAAGFGK